MFISDLQSGYLRVISNANGKLRLLFIWKDTRIVNIKMYLK